MKHTKKKTLIRYRNYTATKLYTPSRLCIMYLSNMNIIKKYKFAGKVIRRMSCNNHYEYIIALYVFIPNENNIN